MAIYCIQAGHKEKVASLRGWLGPWTGFLEKWSQHWTSWNSRRFEQYSQSYGLIFGWSCVEPELGCDDPYGSFLWLLVPVEEGFVLSRIICWDFTVWTLESVRRGVQIFHRLDFLLKYTQLIRARFILNWVYES